MVSILSYLQGINEGEFQIILKDFLGLYTLNETMNVSACHIIDIIAENNWHTQFKESWKCATDHADEHMVQAIMLNESKTRIMG